MRRSIGVLIEADETTCGGTCPYFIAVSGFRDHPKRFACVLFGVDQPRDVDGVPLRCPQCHEAESRLRAALKEG